MIEADYNKTRREEMNHLEETMRNSRIVSVDSPFERRQAFLYGAAHDGRKRARYPYKAQIWLCNIDENSKVDQSKPH